MAEGETIILETPVEKPPVNEVRLERLIIDHEIWLVTLQWLGNNNEAGSATYPTPPILNPLGVMQSSGKQLISALNTADLRNNSLVKRCLSRLQTDGYLPAGTISGTPV